MSIKEIIVINKLTGVEKNRISEDEGVLREWASHYDPELFTISEIAVSKGAAIVEGIKMGKRYKQVCDSCLDYIRYWTVNARMDTAEVNSFKKTFGMVKEYLSDGQPWGAYALLKTSDDPRYDDLKEVVIKLLQSVVGV